MSLTAVVIPTVDDSDALRRSLQSMSQQSVPPDEIVVVANGPTSDGVTTTVSRWSELTPKPVVLEIGNPPNVARALNAGIQATSARYIVRLDVGDWSYPDRIAVQLREMESEHLDLLASSFRAITPEGVVVPNLRGHLSSDIASTKWHLLVQNCIAHPTAMVRRESMVKAGLYDETALFEDYDLWLRTLERWRMKLLDIPLIEYRYSRGSRTREIKAEGTSQLAARYQRSWLDVAGIELSEGAAWRLLSPDLLPVTPRPAFHFSVEAMNALNQLEVTAFGALSPAPFMDLRRRVAVSRIELLTTAARLSPLRTIRMAALVPKSSVPPILRTSLRASRFLLMRRWGELRRREA